MITVPAPLLVLSVKIVYYCLWRIVKCMEWFSLLGFQSLCFDFVIVCIFRWSWVGLSKLCTWSVNKVSAWYKVEQGCTKFEYICTGHKQTMFNKVGSLYCKMDNVLQGMKSGNKFQTWLAKIEQGSPRYEKL